MRGKGCRGTRSASTCVRAASNRSLPSQNRPSRLDPYADKLSHMLRKEAGKSRKQKRTVKQLHADLVALGYDSSYNRVAAFRSQLEGRSATRTEDMRPRRVRAADVFAGRKRSSSTGRKIGAVIAGEQTKLQVAHFKLSTAALFLRAYPQQTEEMLFDAHKHAFRVLGGVPRRGTTTICSLRSTRSGAAENRRSTHGSQPWSATSCSRRSSATRRPAGRRADREERPRPSPSALAADAQLPLAGGVKRLTGDALPGAMGSDAARLASWRDCRRPGPKRSSM